MPHHRLGPAILTLCGVAAAVLGAAGPAAARPGRATAARCSRAVVGGRRVRLCVGRPCRSARKLDRDYALAGFACPKARRHHKARLRRAGANARRLGGVVALGKGGRPSYADALQAFDQIVHPLPKVKRVRGAVGRTHDATLPILWLQHYRGRLSRARRRILDRYTKAKRPRGAAAIIPVTEIARAKLAAESQDAAKRIADQLGVTLKHPIFVKLLTTSQAFGTSAEPAHGYVDPAFYSYADGPCVIYYTQPVLDENAVQREADVAHLVFHCFQFEIHTGQLPSWLFAGSAEWVGDTIAQQVTGAHLDDPQWQRWLDIPELPVEHRAEDAGPFFAQIEQAGGDVWGSLQEILQAGGTGGYERALEEGGDAMLAAWGPNTFQDKALGADWVLEGAGSIHGSGPSHFVVSDGRSGVTLAALHGAADTARITPDADAVRITGTADGQMEGAEGGSQAIAPGTYCTKSGGCPGCPQGEEIPDLGHGEIAIGINAGKPQKTATVTVQGVKFEPAQDCEKAKPKVQTDFKVTAYPGQQVIAHFTSPGQCALKGGTLTVTVQSGADKVVVTVPGYAPKADGSATYSFLAPRHGGPDVVEAGTPYSSGDFADAPDPGIQLQEGAGNTAAGGASVFVFTELETVADWQAPAPHTNAPRYARGTIACDSPIPAG